MCNAAGWQDTCGNESRNWNQLGGCRKIQLSSGRHDRVLLRATHWTSPKTFKPDPGIEFDHSSLCRFRCVYTKAKIKSACRSYCVARLDWDDCWLQLIAGKNH